ncbi:conserved hypothetical protein [Capnocytophaga ochracea DSM 7271]|uniref:Uncharacterized protein n=1 Tax=Capnocytophaga ochracea (strain ATCC 27872 / DSM 7271 / CCUG 9716 / JCM 12966 / NCTC 12371 / SS31 / VPI 2845) TaxID=521097 RepID=C7M5G6_CAPOD|nr:hypothetical protein [Capnocytophaga ochracea]ACU91776.1 conserved hypothetical protein [Capnocytophaga ochracea DSM 7271]UAK50548.1 hypothetical protein K8O87_07205 [Capnocytophaga ochracea]
MNRYITLFLLLFCSVAYAQDVEAMLTEKVKLLDKSYNLKELQTLANDFEHLTTVAPTNWLVNYYVAYTNIRLADQSSGGSIDSYCNQAEKYIKIAEKQPDADASEINALYAYLYSVKVKVNRMFRGAKYGKLSREYSEKSIKENSENPRPYLIRAIGIYFTPKVFGGGVAKAKPMLNKALEKFEHFTPKTPNHPHWGKGMAKSINK